MNETPLIHIGYHKTGTTWLQERVFVDVSIGFARVSPLSVIDDAFLGGNPFTFEPRRARTLLEPSLRAAASSGCQPVISHEPLSGQPVLNGYDSRLIADRLHATYPGGRILIVIREQRSMMLSVYKQHVLTSGTDKVRNMWRKYTPEERRRPTPGLDVFEYHHLIAYYQGLFGKDNVLVLTHEQLKDDPVAFVGEIARSVNLPPPRGITEARDNVAPPGIVVAALRYSNLLLRALGLVGPFGGPVRRERLRYPRYRAVERIGSMTPRWLSLPFDRRLEAAVRRLAGDRFAESNLITARITGLDLAALGYDVGPNGSTDPVRSLTSESVSDRSDRA